MGDRGVSLNGRKVRQLFGLLLTHAGKMVTVDSVIEELWGDAAPATAVETVRTHVFHIRRQLSATLGREAGKDLLRTRSQGYQVTLAEDQLDLFRFERVRHQGQTLLRAGRFEEAVDRFDQAIELWRGPLLEDVPKGNVLEAERVRLDGTRNRLCELRIEAMMKMGGYRDVVDEVRNHVNSDPLNEWWHLQLIDALHRCGRRGEALGAIRALRELLREELGLEPSAEVHRLQQRILNPV
nr:BTAD domain-containing putative transcriptional regulator [Nocardiopsis halotolerans]